MSNLSELLPSGGGQNEVDFVASGTLPNGQAVILNSDGTVTAVAESSGTGAVIPSSSSPQTLSTYSDAYFSSAFSPNTANVFVLAFRNGATGTRTGACVVGTVSGTTISFSTKYIFSSSDVYYIDIAFDPDNPTKFVIAYTDASTSAGTCKIGTLSGTSISYGSAVTFGGGSSQVDSSVDFISSGTFVVAYVNYNSGYSGKVIQGDVSGTSISLSASAVFISVYFAYISLKADPNATNIFVIGYKKSSGGSEGLTIVGTYSSSSNTITYGTPTVFLSRSTGAGVSLSFDPNTTNKFAIAYEDEGVAFEARIGTRSGTSITFGTAVSISPSGGRANFFSISYNPHTANQFVIAYRDQGNSDYGTATVCTVSGSTITAGTSYVYNAYDSKYNSLAFDPSTSSKFIVAFYSATGSGAAILGNLQGSIVTTNLTSTNLLGISSQAITSGATGVINTWGGLNEGQSSLTPASIYYVQENGTISTVATAPAQKIGQAISATTLNILDL